jgi:hypothetical protein
MEMKGRIVNGTVPGSDSCKENNGFMQASRMPSSGIDKISTYLTGNTLLLHYRIQPVCYVRFEVFTAVAMKNVVFWDIKLQFVLHRRHITSSLQSTAS